MEELTPRQKAMLDDYLGLVWEMQRKLLCYAIEKTELSGRALRARQGHKYCAVQSAAQQL